MFGIGLLGATFAVGGAGYQRLRPGYPAAAVDWLIEGLPSAAAAVDVGAGTGKLAAAIAARGFEVVAVDPSADMLSQLPADAGVRTQLGTGEHTNLPDGCADLVTYAQSWHWVDPNSGAIELRRILRPGGRAGWVWNLVDVRHAWVADLAGIWHAGAGQEAVEATHQAPVPGAGFGPLEAYTVDWAQPMTLADLAALVTTRSYYLAASAIEQAHLRDQVNSFLSRAFGDLPVIDLPYRTSCFRAALLP